jgi:regulatory protein
VNRNHHSRGSGKSEPSATPPEQVALKELARRPLTRAELISRLRTAGHDGTVLDEALERLEAMGYVDDLALSLDYIVARADRLGHSRHKLLLDLERRGVDRGVARNAWNRALDQGDVRPMEILRRRVSKELARSGGALDRKAYRRVYNALLRAGFDAASVVEELSQHRSDDPPPRDELDDDFR